MTHTLNHTDCNHDATAAGRKICRTGNALVRDAGTNVYLVVGGTHYWVTQVYAPYTMPAEVRVKTWSANNGWTDRGWMQAFLFANATVDRG